MSFKKKIFGVPATFLGITMGLLVGILAATIEVVQKKFPTVGLVIVVASPLVSFAFEQVMSRAFPEQYWDKLAGNLVKFYRWVTNEDFQLRLLYEMRFIAVDSPTLITPELMTATLQVKQGEDPELDVIGENYLHLRFSGIPSRVSIKWNTAEPEDETEKPVTIFTLALEPEVQSLPMRKASAAIEGTIAKLNRLQELLRPLFTTPPETLASASAWFGDSEPPASPIPEPRIDKTSGARYRLFPGLITLSGDDLAALGAVCRYVGTLQPPPEAD